LFFEEGTYTYEFQVFWDNEKDTEGNNTEKNIIHKRIIAEKADCSLVNT
jgi:hypothetical protein